MEAACSFIWIVGHTAPAPQNRISITTEPLGRHTVNKTRQWVFDRLETEEGKGDITLIVCTDKEVEYRSDLWSHQR
jgi:hypothetical protein